MSLSEGARVIGILVVQFLEVSRVQGENDTADCFGVSKVSCIVLTGEWGMYIGGGLDIVSGFEQQSSQFVGEGAVIEVQCEAQVQVPERAGIAFLPPSRSQ